MSDSLNFAIAVCFFGIIVGIILSVSVASSTPTFKHGREAMEIMETCEEYIPRNINCKIIAVVDE